MRDEGPDGPRSRLEAQTDRRDEVRVAFEQGASNVNKATAIVVDVCERVEHWV